MIANADDRNEPRSSSVQIVPLAITIQHTGSSGFSQLLPPQRRIVSHGLITIEGFQSPHQKAQLGIHGLQVRRALVHHLLYVWFRLLQVETNKLSTVIGSRFELGNDRRFSFIFGNRVLPQVHSMHREPPEAIIFFLFLHRFHLLAMSVQNLMHARGERPQLQVGNRRLKIVMPVRTCIRIPPFLHVNLVLGVKSGHQTKHLGMYMGLTREPVSVKQDAER